MELPHCGIRGYGVTLVLACSAHTSNLRVKGHLRGIAVVQAESLRTCVLALCLL